MSWLMVTCTALFISIVINLLLAWYCIRVLKEL